MDELDSGRLDALVADGASLALLGAGGTGAAPHNPDRFDRVVIDAGHGGDDEGAKGPTGMSAPPIGIINRKPIAKAATVSAMISGKVSAGP